MTKPSKTTKRTKPAKASADQAADSPQSAPRFTKGGRPGPGRPKGSHNRTTLVMKVAIAVVFQDLQDRHGGEGDYSHFLDWAEKNPTDFYRIAAKLIPLQLDAPAKLIGRIVFKGVND